MESFKINTELSGNKLLFYSFTLVKFLIYLIDKILCTMSTCLVTITLRLA
jgi:hypothetical protein